MAIRKDMTAYNVDFILSQIEKVLRTPQATMVDIHFTAAVDEVPTLYYKVEKNLIPWLERVDNGTEK